MYLKEKTVAKKIIGYIKLQVPAGKANPSPPIGPALGQRQLNIMEFCKAFNAATQKMEPGLPVPVIITRPHLDKVGKLSRNQAEEIAKTKMPDLTAADLNAAVRTIAGSARSMGIEVEGI